MIVVACITFGHNSSDISTCLAPALAMAKNKSDFAVISVDDNSGVDNAAAGIRHYVTPTRRGFPAVVQYIVEELYPDCARLVLINPDAHIDKGLRALLAATEVVAVPTIESDGRLANVRNITTPHRELRNLLFGEAKTNFPLATQGSDLIVPCPPYAPSGAVISIDASALRETPLDQDLFWLEFSDWILRRSSVGLETSLRVIPEQSDHLGASTSVSYPRSVAASQARAKVHLIRRYGTKLSRMLVPVAVASKALRFGVKRRSLRDALFVYRAAIDRVDWKVTS